MQAIEVVPSQDGYAVFTSTSDGERGIFTAFFTREADAHEYQQRHQSIDPTIVVAVLDDEGIVCAADLGIVSHDQLRRVAATIVPPPQTPIPPPPPMPESIQADDYPGEW